MAPPRKNVSKAIAAAPASSKGRGKAVEVAEPASRHPIISDVHITDAEDFQSSAASPQRVLTAMSEPRHINEQLLQMLFSLQKQMEEKKTEMGRLREAATFEKDEAAYVQARLLKRVDIL